MSHTREDAHIEAAFEALPDVELQAAQNMADTFRQPNVIMAKPCPTSAQPYFYLHTGTEPTNLAQLQANGYIGPVAIIQPTAPSKGTR